MRKGGARMSRSRGAEPKPPFVEEGPRKAGAARTFHFLFTVGKRGRVHYRHRVRACLLVALPEGWRPRLPAGAEVGVVGFSTDGHLMVEAGPGPYGSLPAGMLECVDLAGRRLTGEVAALWEETLARGRQLVQEGGWVEPHAAGPGQEDEQGPAGQPAAASPLEEPGAGGESRPWAVSLMLMPSWDDARRWYLECRARRLPAFAGSGQVGLRLSAVQFGRPGGAISHAADARILLRFSVYEGDQCTVELFWPFREQSEGNLNTLGLPRPALHAPPARYSATCRIARGEIAEGRGRLSVVVEQEPAVCRAMRERARALRPLGARVRDSVERDLLHLRDPLPPTRFGWVLHPVESALLFWGGERDGRIVRHWMRFDDARFFWCEGGPLEELAGEDLLARVLALAGP